MHKNGSFICSGSLLSEDLVVTSGACIHYIFRDGLSNFRVVLGDSNLNEDIPFGVQEHVLMKALVHENYDINDNLHHHDIGMIILRTPARLELNVCLLCLQDSEIITPTDNCKVVGYGKNKESNNDAGKGILREAEMIEAGKGKCKLPSNNSSSLLCMEGTKGGKACFSSFDGGSPLICLSEGQYFLKGIVSWSDGCKEEDDRPISLFSNVTSYDEWIRISYRSIRPGHRI